MAKITTITNPLTGQPAQVDQLDHTAQQIDDGLNIARGVSNPNLLDNWYFGNPVDQRQGRVVKPNTTYYSDNQLTTSAGTTSAYVTSYRYATGTVNGVNYASFKLEDSDTAPTYYAAPENVVRGYTGNGYTIDRWLCQTGVTAIIEDDGVRIVFPSDTNGRFFYQILPEWVVSAGKKDNLTVSVFCAEVTGQAYLGEPSRNATTHKDIPLVANGVEKWTFKIKNDATGASLGVWGAAGSSVKLKAMKLELGSQQTLAHQDENGNWQLNEIPDYGEQLARCQRYFVRIRPSNNSQTVANGIIDASLSRTWFRIALPSQLRTLTPSISINAGGRFTAVNANTYVQTPLGINATLYGLTTNEIQLGIPVASAKFDALGYCTLVMDTNSYIDIIADL